MWPREGTVLTAPSRVLVDACARLGIDTETLLRTVGIERSRLDDPDARLVRPHPERARLAVLHRYLCSARAVIAVRVAGPLSIFAGPTFNAFVDKEPRKIEPVGYAWKIGSDVQLWPGFLAGLRLF